MNISHLRCGPVGVRFIESRFAGRHKCRPYKDLKWDFLYNQIKMSKSVCDDLLLTHQFTLGTLSA
jgi:hypothetical protein